MRRNMNSSNPSSLNRRHFLAISGVALGIVGAPQAMAAARRSKAKRSNVVSEADVVLFQGDSITDAGRKKGGDPVPNDQAAMGSGYAWLAAADLLVDNPDWGLKILNRGISGNKVYQLAERWDADCLALKPNVLSILIGVNDIWHTLNGNYNGTVDKYKNDYRALLERTRKALPKVSSRRRLELELGLRSLAVRGRF